MTSIMAFKLCLLLFLAVNYVSSATTEVKESDIEFYNPSNKAVIPHPPGGSSTKKIFNNGQCTCKDKTCSCCVGINVKILHFNKLACARVSYLPDEFGVRGAVSVGDKDLISKTISAQNPPPLCASVPGVNVLQVCTRFHDIKTVGKNIQLCVNIEPRYSGKPIFTLRLNCMSVGVDGIHMWKPQGFDGDLSVQHIVVSQASETEVYDHVDFEEYNGNYTTTSTASPVGEKPIGQLKL